MKLSSRLLVSGAVVPTLLLVGALAAAGVGLDQLLMQAQDRALLAQAAVESVSLFDRLQGPHLHADLSPLPTVRGVPASGALYDAKGELRLRVPADTPCPPVLRAGHVGAPPVLTTEPGLTAAGQRVLIVAVPGPAGEAWTLRLAQSLDLHRQTLWAYLQAAALVGLLVAAGLLILQVRHARQLHGRVEALAGHMRRLHAGDLDGQLQPDTTGDVLAELRDLAQDATGQLRHARDSQQRLLADAAHELRTPLAVLQTDLDVTLRRERPVEELRDALTRAREEVMRLGNLARRLLDLASLRATVVDGVLHDGAEMVRTAAEVWNNVAESKGVALSVSIPDQLRCPIPPQGLRQVCDNLLANALDFAPPGSQVELTLGHTASHGELAVRDRGPGIPASDREAVFAPFHRLDRRRAGSGLGLTIVREVAERYGATVHVEAPADGGSRFVVHWPRVP